MQLPSQTRRPRLWQVTQLPLLHSRPPPQSRPLGAFPVSTHREFPLMQSVRPSLQADGSQVMFASQATHWPLLHTRSLPHPRPFGTFPLSRHSLVPEAQDVVPVRQGSPLEQATFAVHGTQLPLLQ
jgi:hypothetical protein